MNLQRYISFDADLAKTIGLQESILVQALFQHCEAGDGVWHHIPCERLASLLPFWSSEEIRAITLSLEHQGVISVNSAPFGQEQVFVFAGGSIHAPNKSKSEAEFQKTKSNTKALIQNDWKPSPDTLKFLSQNKNYNPDDQELLNDILEFKLYCQGKGVLARDFDPLFIKHIISNAAYKYQTKAKGEPMSIAWRPCDEMTAILAKEGIDQSFIADCLLSFQMYWMEKKTESDHWNTIFLKYVRRTWKQYSGVEPQLIDEWHPSKETYQILQDNGIDQAFSEAVVPEFRLYWQDRGEPHFNWNTRFIERVRYLWVNRLAPNTTNRIDPHDLSWAADLN